jgi:hypothetical protein
MAKAATTDAATQEAPAVAPEKYALKHEGFGKYSVEGTNKTFASKTEAEQHVRELLANEQFINEYGDILPEGFRIEDRTLEFRSNIQELPMNEMYQPDGRHNPLYDRAWKWAWARHGDTDLARKQAKGYRPVTLDELEALVEEGQVPRLYLTLLRSVDHGNLLVYGDDVLIRMPRVLWRQRQAEKQKKALAFIQRTDEQNDEAFDRAGMKRVAAGITNEVKTGLKISGF